MDATIVTLAQESSESVRQLRSGFALFIVLIGICVALIVIAVGLTMANRRSRGPGKKRRHAGPRVDPWREAGSRARTPTAWELEKANRPRKKKKGVDPDAFEEGLESGGVGDDGGGGGGGGGGDGGGD